MNRLIYLLIFLGLAVFSKAQEMESAPQMADTFRQEGKIYVVISVIAMIFIAIVILLVYMERKIKKLEEQVGSLEKAQLAKTEEMESRH